MSIDGGLVVGGIAVGFIVGLTGMGGGALLTPMLVFFFGVNPLAAVSSDLVAAAVMKPFGGLVHVSKGTVQWRIVGWLALGSVPSAFCGVLLLRAIGGGQVDALVTAALGVALVLASTTLFAKTYLTAARERRAGPDAGGTEDVAVAVRRVPTVLLGAVGGLVVGMTSVGSGSLMIIALMLLYPLLRPSQLVGSDLVQAVPLVAAAAVGHVLFGDFELAITISLVAGSVPGVVLGALVSSRAPAGLIRQALVAVLLASGLKLLGVSTVATVAVLAAYVLLVLAMALARRRTEPPAAGRSDQGSGRPQDVPMARERT